LAIWQLQIRPSSGKTTGMAGGLLYRFELKTVLLTNQEILKFYYFFIAKSLFLPRNFV